MERFSRILQFNDRVYSKMKDVIYFLYLISIFILMPKKILKRSL